MALLLAVALLAPRGSGDRPNPRPGAAPAVSTPEPPVAPEDPEELSGGLPDGAPPSGARIRELRRQAQEEALLTGCDTYTFEVAVASLAGTGEASPQRGPRPH